MAKRSLSTLNANHNPAVIVPAKIKAALTQLAKDHGAQAYAYEYQNPKNDDAIEPFCKLADLSAAVIAKFRSEFLAHVVEVRQDLGSKRAPRIVWFAKAEAAAAAVKSGAAKAVQAK